MLAETATRSLRELLLEFSHGHIWLPQFQRDYVWTGRRIRNLLDSLFRGLPIGGFFVWQPDKQVQAKPRGNRRQGTFFRGFLLDGQQRLTSLEAAYGLYAQEDRGGEVFECYLDLAAPDEKMAAVSRLFVSRGQSKLVKKRLENGDPTLVPVAHLLEADPVEYCHDVEGQLRSLPGWDHERVYRALERLKRAFAMLNQLVPCTVIRGLTEEEAVEVFHRLNKGGVPLRQADVEAARLVAQGGAEVLNQMRSFVNQELARRMGFGFSFAFRALALFHLGHGRIAKLAPGWVQLPGANGQTLTETWQAVERAMAEAMNFVHTHLHWSTRALLPSANALILVAWSIAQEGGRVSPRSQELYRRWLCLTALRGVFRGAVDTTMGRFLKSVQRHPANPARGLIEGLKQYEAATTQPRDWRRASQPWSGGTQVLYAWLASRGAEDWITGKPLRQLVAGAGSPIGVLTVHHIFPRRVVAELMGDPNLANHPANYALVSRETSTRLRDKSPKEAL
ncbi:MAG: DUF262 domain-containing protein, partial [Bryobacterales bacterium]|nr:DUF262 domain-containing protein [Bryobacteraceae bacterium]MDW8130491.1 DUF262 domain-containing protein [Bryobacterales bacterium]